MADDRLRSVAEAAEYLGIGKSTLQKLVARRAVPFTWIGDSVRFAPHHLAAIVAAGEEPVVRAPSYAQVVAIRAGTDPPKPPPQPRPSGKPGARPPAGPAPGSPPPGPAPNSPPSKRNTTPSGRGSATANGEEAAA